MALARLSFFLLFLVVSNYVATAVTIISLKYNELSCLSTDTACLLTNGTGVSVSDNHLFSAKIGNVTNSWTFGGGSGHLDATPNWPFLNGTVRVRIPQNFLCFGAFGCCLTVPGEPCQLPVYSLSLTSDFATYFFAQSQNGGPASLNVTLLCTGPECISVWTLSTPGKFSCNVEFLTCNPLQKWQ